MFVAHELKKSGSPLDDGQIRIVPLYLIGEYESILRT